MAEGTYKPTDIDYIYNDTSARSISFELLDNVAIYGGFPPGGGTWTQRNPNVYETILSGDIAAPNDNSDNSYHVVTCQDVNNAILDGFTITAANADGSGANEYGGGIYCKDSNNITIRNCVISQNETPSDSGYGGGIYCKDSNNLTLASCTFSDNSAYKGGAVYNNYSDPNITNCIFTDNTVSESGGGMYNNQSSPILLNCAFTANTSTDDSSYGGGMCNNQSSPTLINCKFSGNSMGTSGNGGAIYNTSSDPNITNCTFSNNSAYKGGAVYNNYSDPNITNCIFAGNEIDNCGGGMYNFHGSPEVANCIFTGNIAGNFGGGMFNYDQSYAAVVNSIFSGNRADYYGGGIANSDNSNLTLTNCTVSENWAYYGGGICSWNYADTDLTNCIFWGNDANALGNEIFTDDPDTVIISYSDIEDSNGSGSHWDENLGMDGGYNIDEDPCFFEVEQPAGSWSENAFYDSSTFQSTLTDENADWSVNQLAGIFVNPYTYQYLQFFIVSNDVNTIKVWSDVNDIAGEGDTYHIYDYHLTTDSPCIDAGYPDFNPDPNMTDIDGERRVVDGDANGTEIVDIGADEYYWSPADINTDGFVNFFDYALFANAWLTVPADQDYNDIYDLVDNDCIDSNDLARFCEDWLWQTAWAKAFPFSYGRGMGKSMGMGMGEGFFPSIQAKHAQPELTAADIEQILKWLADLWLTEDELRKMMSDDEWLKFMEAVIQSAKQLIYN